MQINGMGKGIIKLMCHELSTSYTSIHSPGPEIGSLRKDLCTFMLENNDVPIISEIEIENKCR